MPAEETAEEVEGVVPAALAAALLVLLNRLAAVFVVDLARLRVAEDVIGFRYLYELFVGCLIAATWCQMPCGVDGGGDSLRILIWVEFLG